MPGWWKTIFHFLSKDWGKEGRATAWDRLWNPLSAQMPRYFVAWVYFELDWSGTDSCLSPYPLAVILLPGLPPVKLQLNLTASKFQRMYTISYLKYFLILKSLYFKSKMTRKRIPVYFVLTHTLERGGQTVLLSALPSTKHSHGSNCVPVAEAGHRSCRS